jgi:EAL domain-containing protein (putative c-di-GMP-specific phosphodiesterase class I)
MEVVAERVTGVEQLRRLRAAGCDLVQGHLVGKPTAPGQLIAHMNLD